LGTVIAERAQWWNGVWQDKTEGTERRCKEGYCVTFGVVISETEQWWNYVRQNKTEGTPTDLFEDPSTKINVTYTTRYVWTEHNNTKRTH
jgi:hypothetical protein